MSRTIDEKVVSMKFDNRNFEKNAAESISTLQKLKQSLNLSGATKGLQDLSAAANKVDMTPVSSGVDALRMKFSALQVMGVTALANVTNSAINAGKRITKALTIDPIKTGFQEYETQINAVQTILANTQSKGSTLKDVNKALDELNKYADQTIYNFTEMTRNIGTFTAAGVDLDKSVTSIKGIANLAAVSGSNSQQASTAMYQLSQALAAGKVSLMDWNSVVNAGMGGQLFQDALKRTATNMGKNVDAMIKKYGSFRESLTEGEWLTTEVLTETLTQLSGAYSEADLIAQGYTKKQAKEITELAKTAVDAATKVKTFSQLFDTLKEAAQSGWTQSWEIIVGDFEEAKVLLTNISDTIGGIINRSSEARNKVLQGWKDMGGRNDLIDSFANIFDAFGSIVKPISEAFRDIFPPTTAKQLHSLTAGLKEFTEKLKISDASADKLKRTFKGLFSVFDFFRKIIVTVSKAIGNLLGSGGVSGLGSLILSITAAIGDFFTSINEGFNVDGFAGGLSALAGGISEVVGKAARSIEGFGEMLSKAGQVVSDFFSSLWDGVSTVFGWIRDNVSAGDIFAGLAGGGIFLTAKKLIGLISKVKDLFDGDGGLFGILFGSKKDDKEPLELGKRFGEVLDSVHDSLSAFTGGIKVASLLGIAGAIAILSSALKSISQLKGKDIAKSLTAIGIEFVLLTNTFKSVSKSLSIFPAKGIIKAATSMVIMAKAIKVLSDAAEKFSKLKLTDLAKGLIGVGAGMNILTKGMKSINGAKVSLTTSIAMIALAESCKKLADAMSKFGSMDWKSAAKGLVGMGGALGEFVIVLKHLSKIGGTKLLVGSASLVIAVKSLSDMAKNLKVFGSMNWDEITKGLVGMGGALTEVAGVTGLLGKLSGFSGILGASSLVIAVESLDDLAKALQNIGDISWDDIVRGLKGMGTALVEIGTVTGILGKTTGFSGILGASSLVISVQSLSDLADGLEKFGFIAWDDTVRGLKGMGGALTEVAVISGTLGKLTGLSGILGAGSILLGVQGLSTLADALKKFGGMTWEEVAIGLTGMGGALLELGLITGTLGTLAPLGGLIGSGSILIAVQGLGDIADALKKFGEMSWSEIGRGLAAMGGALGELAIGGLLNTLSIIGSMSIDTVAESLGVLADSVKKWEDVELPPMLIPQLGGLAVAISTFTTAIIGAGGLALSAAPLGVLADSVKKWENVTIPEGLNTKLIGLSEGIKAFNWAFMGGWSLSTLASPLGSLADSVKKWKDVTVPAGLKDNLTGIADGIKAFSWAFMGGWSLSAIVGPLGELPTALSKWKNVTMPENLKDNLLCLADGIQAFSWAFMGGWSLGAITGPLGDLATSVSKWKDVTIPEKLGDNLKSLSDAVKSFGWAFVGGWSLGNITGPLGDLASAVKKWNGVSVPSGLGDQLKSLASAVRSFTGIPSMNNGTKALDSLTSSISKISGVNFTSITSGMNSLASSMKTFTESSKSISGVGDVITTNIITPLKNASKQLNGIGKNMIDSLLTGMKSNKGVASTANGIVSSIIKTLEGNKSKFNHLGSKYASELGSGMNKGKSKAETGASSLAKAAKSKLDDYTDDFKSIGKSLAKGFADGISANSYLGAAKAKAMAEQAEKAARKALDINSPSKVFRKIGSGVPEGFAQGITMFGSAINRSVGNMSDRAISSTENAMSHITSIINSDVNAQPTIRPILDLSDVKAGAGRIGNMLGITPSVGVMANLGAINTSMNRRNQNGSNNDVVSAINKLSKDIGKIKGTSYNIGGVSYEKGTEVSDAVEALIRAIKVEGRV